MKKLIFFVFASIALAINVEAQSLPYPQNPDPACLPTMNPQSLNGILLTGSSIYTNDGSWFWKMNLSDPSTPYTLFEESAIEGDFDDFGNFYYTESSYIYGSLLTIDFNTGTETVIANLSGVPSSEYFFILSMSYFNGTMYAIFGNYSYSDIFTINLNTGNCTLYSHNHIPGFFTVMAIDKSGNFFGIDANTNILYEINPVAGNLTAIGNTGLSTYQYCDADFNYFDNNLYYVGPTNSTCIINTTDASTSQISTVWGYLSAVNSPSGSPVPFKPIYLIISFILIAGFVFVRKWFL